MNICSPFIRRPVMTTLLTVSVVLAGALGYTGLPVNDLPNVDFPTIQVSASLPGASPEDGGLRHRHPTGEGVHHHPRAGQPLPRPAHGMTSITLQFNLDRNIDAAALDVQSAISKAARSLPPDMPAPPSFRKVNPADSPIMILAMWSETLPVYEVNEYGETFLAERLSLIPGVAQVSVFGQQKKAVRVQADPDLLAARGIGIDEVSAALREGNVNLPTGTFQGKRQSFIIQSTGQLTDARAYRPLIVTYRGGSPVRLEQVATVIDSVENDRVAGWAGERGPDGEPSGFRSVNHAGDPVVLDAVDHGAEFAQPDRLAVAVGDDHRAVLSGARELAGGLDVERPPLALERAGRQVDVRVPDGRGHLVDADAAGRPARSGSTCTRTARFCWPKTTTWATPWTMRQPLGQDRLGVLVHLVQRQRVRTAGPGSGSASRPGSPCGTTAGSACPAAATGPPSRSPTARPARPRRCPGPGRTAG